MVLYTCVFCDFSTNLKGNYNRHISTLKHGLCVENYEKRMKMSQMSQNEPQLAHFSNEKKNEKRNEPKKSQNEPKPAHFGSLKKNKKNESKKQIFKCIYCDKIFKTNANKRRHELHRCKKTGELELKNELEQKTELVKMLLEEKHKHLEEKYEAILEEKEKCIDALKNKYSNVTNNNTLNLMQNKIYMMKPIEFLNTFYKNNPSLEQVVNAIKQADFSDEELKTLKEACAVDNRMVIAKEIDNLMKKKNRQLITDSELTCDNVVFSNDGSNRKYIAKGSDEWQYFSNDDLIDKSTSFILEKAALSTNIKYAKKERNAINNNIKKLNDFNNTKTDLYKQLDGDNIETHNTIESTIINNDVLQTINTEVIDTISDDDSEININILDNFDEISESSYEHPCFDENKTYKVIEDCGKKHYYDEDNNVFSLNKVYEGIRVHDEDCDCTGECWYYVKYYNEI